MVRDDLITDEDLLAEVSDILSTTAWYSRLISLSLFLLCHGAVGNTCGNSARVGTRETACFPQ